MKLFPIPVSGFSWALALLLPHPLEPSCRKASEEVCVTTISGLQVAIQWPTTHATCSLAPAAGVILWDERHGELTPTWWSCLWCEHNELPGSIGLPVSFLATSTQVGWGSSTAAILILSASAATSLLLRASLSTWHPVGSYVFIMPPLSHFIWDNSITISPHRTLTFLEDSSSTWLYLMFPPELSQVGHLGLECWVTDVCIRICMTSMWPLLGMPTSISGLNWYPLGFSTMLL